MVNPGTYGKLYQIFDKELMSLQNNLFQNKKQEETLNEARITLLPKQRHCKKRKGVLYTTIPH